MGSWPSSQFAQGRYVPSSYPSYDKTTGAATNAADANLAQFAFVQCGRYYKSFANPLGWPHLKLANKDTFEHLFNEYLLECQYDLWVAKRDRVALSKGYPNYLAIKDPLDAMSIYSSGIADQGTSSFSSSFERFHMSDVQNPSSR